VTVLTFLDSEEVGAPRGQDLGGQDWAKSKNLPSYVLLIDDEIDARHARRQGWRKGRSTAHAVVVVDEAEPANNAGTLRLGRLHLLKMGKKVATP
jgi:hypothetical protein